MKATDFSLIRYDADEGCMFDWKEPRYYEDADGNQIQEHLYMKTLYIGGNDTIANYVEIAADGTVTDLADEAFANRTDYETALAELGVE